MLQGEELSQTDARGDIFLIPSESENTRASKAMSYGLPVEAAHAGGVPDIIPAKQEGKIGTLLHSQRS